LIVSLQAGFAQTYERDIPRAAGGKLGDQQTTTDGNGYYEFRDVLPETYTLCIAGPAGYWPTTKTRVSLTVGANQDWFVYFGFYQPPVIGYLPLGLYP
jgi:hypothetical protein